MQKNLQSSLKDSKLEPQQSNFKRIRMENFFSDLNELLASDFGLTHNTTFGLSASVIVLFLSILAFWLTIHTVIKIANRRPKPIPMPVQVVHSEPKKEITIDIGEFGKIISEKKVSIKGIELDYFIVKKSKYEKDSLPIGTIVVVIKKNANEAYVKPADDKDKIRLKGLI